MSLKLTIILIVVVGIIVMSLAVYLLLISSKSAKDQMQGLLQTGIGRTGPRSKEDIDRIKRMTAVSKAVKEKEDLSTLLFKAGFYAAEDRANYQKKKIICLVGAPPLVMFIMAGLMGFEMIWIVLGLALGLIVGLTLPRSQLDKAIRLREQEVMYYLPLVIEEISISTSSGLEPGSCISHIIHLADQRSSHNAVTDMLTHVIRLVRSGMNLESALVEVGEASGKHDVKHAFMFLAQSIKHGGEMSKQLQDLADSVATNKQTEVEAKISALPVKATFPLFLVFAGFFLMLMVSIFTRVMNVFD